VLDRYQAKPVSVMSLIIDILHSDGFKGEVDDPTGREMSFLRCQ
jgi:hypothetical protein